jgi:hypothetical protein
MEKFGIGFIPYKNAAEKLLEIANNGVLGLSQGDSQAGLDASAAIPSQALFGFAAELGMKAALEALGREVPRSHDLRCLFDRLPICRTQGVRDRVNDLEFDQRLSQHRAIFEDSRYFFQPPKHEQLHTADYVFLKRFVDALLQEFGTEILASAGGGNSGVTVTRATAPKLRTP